MPDAPRNSRTFIRLLGFLGSYRLSLAVSIVLAIGYQAAGLVATYLTGSVAAAVKAAGKPVQVIESPNYHHLEMAESLGNPYGPNGRAALAMMKLAPT